MDNLSPRTASAGQYLSSERNVGNATATTVVNWNLGNCQRISMGANITTLTLQNPVAGARYLLRLVQDATGGRTVAWPASVRWPGGTAPTLSGANKVDLIALYFDGTNYYGSYGLNY